MRERLAQRMLRLAAFVVRLYPRTWRARYEDEVLALLDELPPTFPHIIDFASGAAWEWVQTSATFRRWAAFAWALVCWGIGVGASSWPFDGLDVDSAFLSGAGCFMLLLSVQFLVLRRRSVERQRTLQSATIALPPHWLVLLAVTTLLSIGVGLQLWAKAGGALAGTNDQVFSLLLLFQCCGVTGSILDHWTRWDNRVSQTQTRMTEAGHARSHLPRPSRDADEP